MKICTNIITIKSKEKIKGDKIVMKNKKVSIKTILIVLVIFISIALILIKFNNKNSNIEKQETSKEQLTQTTGSNSYVTMADHLSEVDAKQNIIYIGNGFVKKQAKINVLDTTLTGDNYNTTSYINCQTENAESFIAPKTGVIYVLGEIHNSNSNNSGKVLIYLNGTEIYTKTSKTTGNSYLIGINVVEGDKIKILYGVADTSVTGGNSGVHTTCMLYTSQSLGIDVVN